MNAVSNPSVVFQVERVLVTGATGFIGRRLISRWIGSSWGDRGKPPVLRALVRSDSPRMPIEDQGVEVVSGDITDSVSVHSAMEGCDALIHLAALRASWHRRLSEFERINVLGTRIVLNAALESGIRKALHVSTTLVLGPSGETSRSEIDREPLTQFVSEYQRTKFLAEQEADRLFEKGLPLVTVYPSSVYGPSLGRGESPVTDVLSDIARGKFVPFVGSGNCYRNLVYVDDVVEGLMLALQKAQPGSRYILSGENVTHRDLIRLLVELSGCAPPLRHIPVPVALGAGRLLEIGGRLAGLASLPWTSSTVRILSKDWRVSCEKARKELGYRPLSLREGLLRTLQV